MIKVIAFDVFGTVVDMSGVPPHEQRDYGRHLRDYYANRVWKPLSFPKSWETIPAHPDSADGIARLREKFIVVTCSNGPLGFLAKLLKHNKISMDAIIPLEMNHVFKTNPAAYLTVCEVLDVKPEEVAMVTANETFGDLEASGVLGMRPILIRDGNLPTIGSLADLLLSE